MKRKHHEATLLRCECGAGSIIGIAIVENGRPLFFHDTNGWSHPHHFKRGIETEDVLLGREVEADHADKICMPKEVLKDRWNGVYDA